jgi:hypothetical protein
MMKQLLIISFFLFSGIHSFSQNYIDKIVAKACDSLENIPDSVSLKDYTSKLGITLIQISMPYKQELKRDYKIDLDNLDKSEGEKLGKLIGVRLLSACPKALNRLIQKTQEVNVKAEENQKEITGIVTGIDNSDFVIFSLKDEFDRVYKFYWLQVVKSDIDLMNNYNSLVGKTIKLTYEKKDFFDPKITDYRSFNVIVKIESE